MLDRNGCISTCIQDLFGVRLLISDKCDCHVKAFSCLSLLFVLFNIYYPTLCVVPTDPPPTAAPTRPPPPPTTTTLRKTTTTTPKKTRATTTTASSTQTATTAATTTRATATTTTSASTSSSWRAAKNVVGPSEPTEYEDEEESELDDGLAEFLAGLRLKSSI